MIQKQERGERLVLRRGTHMGCCSQTRQEPSHIRFAQVGDGPHVMKAHEALDPVAVRLLGVAAEMSGASGKAYPFEKWVVSWNSGTVHGNIQMCAAVPAARGTERWAQLDRLSCKEREQVRDSLVSPWHGPISALGVPTGIPSRA